MPSKHYLDVLVQDCSNSSVNTLELLQSCIKTLICLSPFLSCAAHSLCSIKIKNFHYLYVRLSGLFLSLYI